MSEAANSSGQQDARDAFGELHAQLKQAYWAATTIESKDRIRGLEEIVFEITTALNQSDIRSSTSDFAALTTQVKAATDRLKQLKEEIDQIVHNIAVATQVASAIEKAISAAAWVLKA